MPDEHDTRERCTCSPWTCRAAAEALADVKAPWPLAAAAAAALATALPARLPLAVASWSCSWRFTMEHVNVAHHGTAYGHTV